MVKSGGYLITDSPNNNIEIIQGGDGKVIEKLEIEVENQYAVAAIAVRDMILIAYN